MTSDVEMSLQMLSAKNERTVTPGSSRDAASTGYPGEADTPSGPISLVGDSTICPDNSDSRQAQPLYCGGIFTSILMNVNQHQSFNLLNFLLQFQFVLGNIFNI